MLLATLKELLLIIHRNSGTPLLLVQIVPLLLLLLKKEPLLQISLQFLILHIISCRVLFASALVVQFLYKPVIVQLERGLPVGAVLLQEDVIIAIQFDCAAEITVHVGRRLLFSLLLVQHVVKVVVALLETVFVLLVLLV